MTKLIIKIFRVKSTFFVINFDFVVTKWQPYLFVAPYPKALLFNIMHVGYNFLHMSVESLN